MADLQPVRPPRSRLSGHGALIGTLVVLGVLMAAVKPWGGTGGPPAATLFPSSVAGPLTTDGSAAVATPLASGFDLRYRPELFGPQPPPRWGLWPAGYLTTFGFAVAVPPTASPRSSPPTGPGGSPTGRPMASAIPPADPGEDGVPAWPSRVEINEGSHLLMLGISTPVGYHVPQVQLFRSDPDGGSSLIETELLPSPWPDHFTVIGIRSRAADGSLKIWPSGRYRLDWVTDPGAIQQSIEITIQPVDDGPDGSPTPSGDPPVAP